MVFNKFQDISGRYSGAMEDHTIDEVYDLLSVVAGAIKAQSDLLKALSTDVETRVLRAEHEALMIRVSRLEAAIA